MPCRFRPTSSVPAGLVNSPGHDPRGGGDRYSSSLLYQPGGRSIGS